MKSILILGLGLIGGSLAKAIKESGLEYRILAYDPDQLSLENALNDKSIDEAVYQIEKILQIEDLSLIMLCSSIDKTIENLKFLKGIDSLLSILQMPAGIPVGTLAIGSAGAKNAALLAASILSSQNTKISKNLEKWRLKQTKSVAISPIND